MFFSIKIDEVVGWRLVICIFVQLRLQGQIGRLPYDVFYSHRLDPVMQLAK